jgi:type IV pilus assembly protein PilB
MSELLGSLMLKAGVITPQQLTTAQNLARSRQVSLLDVLSYDMLIPEDDLADAFARTLRLQRVRLVSTPIEAEAMKAVGEKMARRHLCVPLKIEGKSLALAMVNPADVAAIQEIEFAVGVTVRPVVATKTEILDAIDSQYAAEERIQNFLADVATPADFQILGAEKEEEDEVSHLDLDSAELPPVVKMCNLIINDGVKSQASDIHIEPGLHFVQVRMRIDGVLREYMQVPKWLQTPLVSRLKILSRLDIAEHRVPQDGRIKVHAGNRAVDLRVSTLPTHFGEKMVLRILGSANIPSMGSLGLFSSQLPILEGALSQPQGMVLVTGPTGSGKSTTLYSLLMSRKSPEVNIVTVEDPIEYQLPGINQVQVNVKAGLTFATSLRSILRQDPDIVLVGEVRDLETAEIAFQAAMTGHLVLSTLHTNSSLATVARLLDLGVDPHLITGALTLIVAQRLVRRVCQKCKESYLPQSGLLEKLRLEEPGLLFHHGKGCPSCGGTGFSGRVGVFELLRMTPTIKDLIHRKASEADLRKAAGMTGTRFLLDDAMEKMRQGVTTLEEVLRVVQLQEDEITRCPKCNAFINLDFSSCPYCLLELKRLCQQCGQELKLEWNICPYCSAQVKRAQGGDGSGEGERLLVSEPEAAGSRVDGGASTILTTLRILIVDDDEDIKTVVRMALRQLPVPTEIRTASDGVEALESISKQPADLVILDVMMPRMDGLTACQRLRGDVRTAFIPIMMMTASADESNRTQGYLVGTDDYINKPFSVTELNARVMRLIKRSYRL